MINRHYPHPYLANPQHAVTVDLVGLGGTGSQVLQGLGRMHASLKGLGHPGLHVRAWDPDQVTPSNIGRQLFSDADMGLNKATVLVQRLNRFYGTAWEAQPGRYTGKVVSNLVITCVDTVKARLQIADNLKKLKNGGEPYNHGYYWMDFGNTDKAGQVVLGTIVPINQIGNRGIRRVLPNVVKKLPGIKRVADKDTGPSCSLAEALDKQDLFINTVLAAHGCALLWKLFRDDFITTHGLFLNLETGRVNPIPIK